MSSQANAEEHPATASAPVVAMRPGFVTAIRGHVPWPVIVVAFGLYGMELLKASVDRAGALDNLIVVHASQHLLDGVSPYVERRFLYPPSSIPFALLQAPFPDGLIRHAAPFVVGAMLLTGWWCALRMFDVSRRSWLGVVPVATAAWFVPATSVAMLSSWTAPVAAAGGIALLLMARERWVAAALVIGLSIAVKPMLMPVGLVFLLARRWRALAVCAGLPLAVFLAMLPLLPEPQRFFTETIPFLLSGQDAYSRPYDSSLPVILPRLGLAEPVVNAIRAAVLLLTLGAAVLRWRAGGDHRLRLSETTALLMTGTFLVSTPAFPHYAMVIVPVLVAGVVLPGSVARNVFFWFALLPLFAFVQLPLIDYAQPGENRESFAFFIALVVLLAVLVWTSCRVPPPETGSLCRQARTAEAPRRSARSAYR